MSELADNDIINLKQVILGLKDYFYALLNSWLLIIISALIFAGIFAYRNYKANDEYVASLTYMLEDNEAGNLGGISGLLGSFGIKSGKGLNRDKLVELSRSERIIKRTIMQKVPIGGKLDYLGNHIIKTYEFDLAWNKNSNHSLFEFQFEHDTITLFGERENEAVKYIKSKINGSPRSGVQGLLSSSYNDDSGILYLNANTTDPELSIHLVTELYDVLDSFFVTKAIEKQKQNFEIIKNKTDSLTAVLESTEYSLAKFKDSERNLFRKVDRVEETRLTNKAKMLYIALGKALENQELADYSLKYQTPLLSVIDSPYLPIKNSKLPLIFSILLGLIYGGILACAFIIIRKKYNEIMA